MAHTSGTYTDKDILSEKIKGIRVAMLTTIDRNRNILRSRPMITQETPFDGTLWFLTQISAHLVDEAENRQVNISYASPQENRYVSVSGVAQLVRDQQKTKELWTPKHSTWFSGGKDDPELALLKVTVTDAEYWDSSNHKMMQILQSI